MAASMVCRGSSKFSKLLRLCQNTAGRRYLLSSAYPCTDKWKKRLESSVFHGVDVNRFAIQVYDKFEKEGGASAIDMDILANKIQEVDPTQMEFTEKLFNRFRYVNECLTVMDSTHHGLLRGLLDIEETDRILEILQDKNNYGIFLDHYSANILMDHFIKLEKFSDAADVAYELMLQEDFDNVICQYMALYSCHMHLRNPSESTTTDEEETQEVDNDSQEVIYMRVPIVRNPHFDDHFDLVKDEHLLGKTLKTVGKVIGGVVGRSYQIIGLGLYEKFDDAFKLMKDILATDGSTVTADSLEKFKSVLESAEAVPDETTDKKGEQKRLTEASKEAYRTEFEEVSKSLHTAGKVTNESLHDLLVTLVQQEIPKHEETDIEALGKLIEHWNEEREVRLNSQIKNYRDAKKKAEIIKKLKELQAKEEFLNYYAYKGDIDLACDLAPKEEKAEEKQEVDAEVKKYMKWWKK